jgi:segregation and condensation protein B
MAMEFTRIKRVVEGLLHAADRPLSINEIHALFAEDEVPAKDDIRKAVAELQAEYGDRGFELVQVASGFRIQVRQEIEPWISRLWEEKPPRYTRALLETLALIAYRQPITRGEIEDIRGVSVSSNIIKTLQERNWVRVLGHKDVPGRPAMYGTTRQFLDYFNLKSLSELPSLTDIKDLDSYTPELKLALAAGDLSGEEQEANGEEPGAPEMPEEPAGDEPGEGPDEEVIPIRSRDVGPDPTLH